MKKFLIYLIIASPYTSMSASDTTEKVKNFFNNLLRKDDKHKSYDHTLFIDFPEVAPTSPDLHSTNDDLTSSKFPDSSAITPIQEISEINDGETVHKQPSYRYIPASVIVATTVIIGSFLYYYKTPIIDRIIAFKNKVQSYFY